MVRTYKAVGYAYNITERDYIERVEYLAATHAAAMRWMKENAKWFKRLHIEEENA